ncbi:hypothetical protein BDC45DRAFT_267743 [Circinella umbellata]|nr:hypothetical protein BDC45DRAFT_267743 [Circinella umbellata]
MFLLLKFIINHMQTHGHQCYAIQCIYAEKLGFKNNTSFCQNSTAPDFDTNYESYGCLAPYEYFCLNMICLLIVFKKIIQGVSVWLTKAFFFCILF